MRRLENILNQIRRLQLNIDSLESKGCPFQFPNKEQVRMNEKYHKLISQILDLIEQRETLENEQ